MKKFTTREKIILGGGLLVLVIVGLKLKDDVFKVGAEYNDVADKLCSGGNWQAINICPTGFDLVRTSTEVIL